MPRTPSLPILPALAVLLALAPVSLKGQTLAPTTVPDTSIGSTYDVPLTVVNGQCTVYDWSISGTLPPGLSIFAGRAPANAIRGTAGMPLQDSYTFSVTAGETCDSSDAIRSYTIRVLAISNSSFPIPTGTVARSYSHTFSALGVNATAPARWRATGLPPGLEISNSGQISGTPTTAGTFTGTVTVFSDVDSRTATRSISIVITPPLVFVNPATLPAATVGVPYSVTIQATGGVPPVSIFASLATVALGLSYNQSTATISGTPTAAGTYSINLSAFDATQRSVTRTFTVAVSQPNGLILTQSLPSGTIGIPYSATLTSSGFFTAPTWSTTNLPPALALNPSTGVISGLPGANGTYAVTISASTSLQTAQHKTLLIVIAPPALDFTPTALPSGVVGAAYSAVFTATGGDGSYDFSAGGGGLPPGLILSRSGGVSGTPTQAGAFQFSVRVISMQVTTEKMISMSVDAVAMQLTPSVLAPILTGAPFSQTFIASGGSAPYVFQFGANSSVVPGLALSSGGVLAGTPTAVGTYRFSIEVLDARQRRLQRDYTLVVMAPSSIVTTTLPDGTEGEAYRAVIESSSNTAAPTYEIAAGALPAGLVLNAAGPITGTPTMAGRFQFTVRSTDANQRTSTRELSIVVFAAIVITPDSLPGAGLLRDYSAQLAATGGQPGYVWQIGNGSLPDGILFTGGVFRGLATRAGTYAFAVTVTDQRQRTATKRFAIVVAEGLSILMDGAVSDGVVGLPYTARFRASAGRAPFRWSVNGELPPGLNLSAAEGSITGAPTTTGVFAFTLRVEDSDGLAASGAFRIRVVVGAVPPGTISGIGGATGPSNQITFGLSIASPFSAPLDGAVVLTFQPDSGFDDPAVLFSNGSRRMPFTVPAGSTAANFPVGRAALQTGTVAGLITTTGSFNVNGTDVTPQPAPVSTVRIDPAPPVITRMDTERTSTGFAVTIYGFTTARQLTQARVTLTPADGFSLASTEFTVELGTLFSTYYSSAASAPFGSQFKLVLPFTLSDPLGVSAVSVTLVNALGSSAVASSAL